jgi:hypothetical protein
LSIFYKCWALDSLYRMDSSPSLPSLLARSTLPLYAAQQGCARSYLRTLRLARCLYLCPLNPERVLRTVPKSAAKVNILTTNKVSCQDAVLQTPVNPVSAEGLMSLQTIIMQKDAHALNETNKQALQRHQQEVYQSRLFILYQGSH